jgi:hypothetical protein
MADTPDGRAVHDVVARAAGLRDRFARRRRAWRAAPWLAAVCLVIAVAGRLIGWPPALALACGAGLGVLLAAYALLPRDTGVVHDHDAAALDDRAALGGELRSAHWFAAQQDAGAWVTYHLARAADRIRAAPWPDLYAPQRMPRTYAVTAVLAVTAAIVTFVGPTTRAARAPGVHAGRAGAPDRALTAAEIERQLAALLATLESGDPAKGRPATADDIRALLEAVREAQRQNAGRPGATIDDALEQRLDRVSQKTSLDPDIRGALEDLKKALAASKPENAKTGKTAGEPTEKGGAPQADAAQTNQAGGQDAATAQMLSDSQPGAGYGVVGMTNEPGAPPRDAGLGMGGGDGGSPNSGVMVDLGAALRRETLESGAGESAGDPATDLRHKTDRGKASVAFSRGAAAATERGPGNAVPVIPEARRPAARAYFQRKR